MRSMDVMSADVRLDATDKDLFLARAAMNRDRRSN